MTTPNHTLGPWQVNDSTENDDDTTLTIFAPADEVEIATMNAYENGCESFSEIRANAALIAAAPAMYEALRRIKELMDSGDVEGRDWVEYGQVTNALAQAEDKP